MGDPTALAFWASLFLAMSGAIVALGGTAAGQYRCAERPELNQMSGPGSDCSTALSLYWVSIALELLFLAGLAACAACKAIHPFRSTLWSAGAVAAALGIRGANDSYNFLWLTALADSKAYNGQLVYMIGAAIWVAGNLLLAFTGDAMYRAKRIEGRDGFVTFRRTASKAAQGLEFKDDQREGEQQEGQDAAPTASQAGPMGWLFLAALAVSVAGTFVALGGIGSLQHYCLTHGVFGQTNFLEPCNRELSLRWVVWGLQFCFLAATGLCYKAKQIHNYRASLWSLAAVVTGLSSYIVYWFIYDYTKDGVKAQNLAAWNAALAGFCMVTLANCALIVGGDYLYRLRHEEGADGFVSMRRPGPYAKPAEPAVASIKPRRAIEWAFALSIALAIAGTILVLGALAGAQANCSPEQLNWRGRGDRCSRFLAYTWFAMALEVLVLAGTIAAWALSYVHSFKASLWSLAAVVTLACVLCSNWVYQAWGFSAGATHDSLVACLYGFAVVVSANYLVMATGDALHQLRREENAAGFVTFRRPNLAATKPAASADQV